MILQNKHNLPDPLVQALSYDSYRKQGRISVTELIGPPRIRQLTARHEDKLEIEVSDRVWLLLGSAVHEVIDRVDASTTLQEQRLAVEIEGWTVSGKADLFEYRDGGIISDYKVTSVFSFLLGDKPLWEQQLNVYAALFRAHGFDVNGIQIVAILRDWSRHKAMREPDYPDCAIHIMDVPLWEPDQATEFIRDRVRLHQQAEHTPDDDLPECTSEERWCRPDSWAVIKNGGKRAFRVFDNAGDADELAAERGPDYRVDHRRGDAIRCSHFCDVAQFCSQANPAPF